MAGSLCKNVLFLSASAICSLKLPGVTMAMNLYAGHEPQGIPRPPEELPSSQPHASLTADTLVEAIVNFDDLTVANPASKNQDGSQGGTMARCNPKRYAPLIVRLVKVGMIPKSNRKNVVQGVQDYCSGSRPNARAQSQPNLAEDSPGQINDFTPIGRHRIQRDIFEKRNGTNDEVDESNETVMKCENIGCEVCWMFKRFPEGHKPRYMNVLRLGKDRTCLGKKGACRLVYEDFNISVQSSNGDIANKSVSIARAVECVLDHEHIQGYPFGC